MVDYSRHPTGENGFLSPGTLDEVQETWVFMYRATKPQKRKISKADLELMSCPDIAKELGFSTQRAHQLLKSAMEKLRLEAAARAGLEPDEVAPEEAIRAFRD